jgi:hypothetical protein
MTDPKLIELVARAIAAVDGWDTGWDDVPWQRSRSTCEPFTRGTLKPLSPPSPPAGCTGPIERSFRLTAEQIRFLKFQPIQEKT